MIDKNNQQA